MIKTSKQFWDALTEKPLDFDRVRKLTETLLTQRRSNKDLFRRLTSIFSYNTELELLSYVYSNFVSWEPVDRRVLKKRVKTLVKRLEIMRRDPHFLNPFDENACVVGININGENPNTIVMASNNTARVFEANKAALKVVKLNNLMPNLIGKRHAGILENFRKSQRSPYINNVTMAWGVSGKRRLFLLEATIKMIYTVMNSYYLAYVRAVCYKKYLFTNIYGEIDTFGEYFNRMTKLDHDIAATCPSISLFMFIPALLVHFLPFFYDHDDFSLQQFQYRWLDTAFLFVFKDQNKMVRELSKLLENKKTSKEDYCGRLYDYLSRITYSQVKRVFQIKVAAKEFRLRRQAPEIRFVEVTISDLYEVTELFTEPHFSQSFIFLEKLQFDKALRSSLGSYGKRAEELNYEAGLGMEVKSRMGLLGDVQTKVSEGHLRRRNSEHSDADDGQPDERLAMMSSARLASHNNVERGRYSLWVQKKKSSSSDRNSQAVLGRYLGDMAVASKRRMLFLRFCASIEPQTDATATRRFWWAFFDQVATKLSMRLEEKGQDVAGGLTRKGAGGV